MFPVFFRKQGTWKGWGSEGIKGEKYKMAFLRRWQAHIRACRINAFFILLCW